MRELTKRQDEILDKAIDLIAERGMGSLTIRNLSREIGVSEPAIYRHFESKHSILDGVLDRFSLMSMDVLGSEGLSVLGGLGRVEYFLMDRYRRFAGNRNLAKVMISEELFQDDPRLSAKVFGIMHSHREVVCGFLEMAVKEGGIRDDIDGTSLFRIIFGPMRLLVKQWCLSGFGFDLEDEGRGLWEAEKMLLERRR